MMTVCPKCGFEQPKDRFCAKCGIQMDSFKVAQPTISQRIASSSLFYGALLVVTVTIGTYVVYQKANQNPAEELGTQLDQSARTTLVGGEKARPSEIEKKANLAAQPTSNESKANGVAEVIDAMNANAETNPSSANSAAEAAPPPSAIGFAAQNESKGIADSANQKSNKKSELEIQFLKIDQNSANDFAEDSDGKLAFGSASKGVIPNFRAKLERTLKQPGNENLATESRVLSMGQASVIFQGGRDPKGETVGFFVDVFPVKNTDRGIEIKINVRRMLPEASGEEIKVNTSNVDESFVIPANGAAFVGGLLPRSTVLEPPDSYANVSVLKPLLDQRFQRSGSEFVILIAPSLTDSNPSD